MEKNETKRIYKYLKGMKMLAVAAILSSGFRDTGILIESFSHIDEDLTRGSEVVISEKIGQSYKVTKMDSDTEYLIPSEKVLDFSVSGNKFRITNSGEKKLYVSPIVSEPLRDLSVNEIVLIQEGFENDDFYYVKTSNNELGFVKKNSGIQVGDSVKPIVYASRDLTLTNGMGVIFPVKKDTELLVTEVHDDYFVVSYDNINYSIEKELIYFPEQVAALPTVIEEDLTETEVETEVGPSLIQDEIEEVLDIQESSTEEVEEEIEEVEENTPQTSNRTRVNETLQARERDDSPSTQEAMILNLAKGVSSKGDTFSKSQQEKSKKVVDTAISLIGTPYLWGGITRNGIDCSGLTSLAYKEGLGITINRVSRDQVRNGFPVSISQLQPGDILFFNGSNGGTINHVGLYAGDGMFVHASQTQSKVVMGSVNSTYFRTRYVGARRLIEN